MSTAAFSVQNADSAPWTENPKLEQKHSKLDGTFPPKTFQTHSHTLRPSEQKQDIPSEQNITM